MNEEPDIQALSQSQDICIHHVGSRDAVARVLLGRAGEGDPAWSIDLDDTRSLYHVPTNGTAAVVRIGPVGSFGWWLSAKERYRQLEIRRKDTGDAILLAIAGSVACRECNGDAQDLNYPG